LTVRVRRGLQCHPKSDVDSLQGGIFAEALFCQIAGIDDTAQLNFTNVTYLSIGTLSTDDGNGDGDGRGYWENPNYQTRMSGAKMPLGSRHVAT